MQQQKQEETRIVVMGRRGVGKSALTIRYIQGCFVEKYDPTIEDSFRKLVKVDGKPGMLDIMDTGTEENSTLRDQYLRSGHGLAIVYDITNTESFKEVQKILCNILRLEILEKAVVLVGNKTDLWNQRKVTTKEGEDFAHEKGWLFLESSAKANENVGKIFEELVRRIRVWRKPLSPREPFCLIM